VSSADPLVVTPDARFGGGGQAMIDAFVDGARSLGRTPRMVSPGFIPVVDGIHQYWAARRVSREARAAESVWVVAAVGPYGAGAADARKPYACWLATSLADEWPSRVHELSAVRRVVHAVNAPFLLQLERNVLAHATAIYGISPASRDVLARAAGRTDVGVLPVPVDLDRFSPEPDKRWLDRLAAPTIVFLGRADDPRKNIGLLLDAWPRILEALPTSRLVLVGRPPTGSLPPGVETRGNVTDVASELQPAALLALPSLQEGFGIVAAEALACGVPVLSAPCGGPEHLLRESSAGSVLKAFDPDELAETAIRLLSNPEELVAMRHRGRAYVEGEHAPQVFRSRLEALLELHADG
jgi:glycosyltransferase involved in cell wall biosynthesis